MEEPLAYLKDRFVPASQCVLPVYDLGIVLGAAVTDFVRTFHQRPFRIEDHVRRLYRSCKYARIEPPIGIDESLAISEKLLATNSRFEPEGELGLVYYITAGENTLYAGGSGVAEKLTATYVQHTFPLRFHLWRDIFRHGAHCVTPAVRHWPPECLSSKIKSRNRLHKWIGEQEVRGLDSTATALFLDIHGNITETNGSNFVIYRQGKVISPRPSNILWGVSLTVVREIVEEMGLEFSEEDLQTYDVVNAEEAWLPTTPYCLGPVVRINGEPIGDGRPGLVWRRVLDRWSEIVGKDIYREIAESTNS